MLSRRTFLTATAGLLAASCGGSDAPAELPATAPALPSPLATTLTGRVEISQLGNSPFQVWSPFGAAARVQDGLFTTTTSGIARQLQVLLDSLGNIRALSIAEPGQSLLFDAQNTAKGLMSLVPGILRTRLDDPLPPVDTSALVSLLAPRLATRTIGELLEDEAVQEAINTAAEPFFAPAQARLDPAPPTGLTLADGVLLNQVYRVVQVTRELRDTQGQLVREEELGFLLPAQTLHPGSLFLTQEGKPTQLAAALPPPGLTQSFRVRGPSLTGPPPPGAPRIEPPSSSISICEMIYLLGELSAASQTSATDAELAFVKLMSEVGQQQAQAALNQLLQAAEQQQQANHLSGIAKLEDLLLTALRLFMDHIASSLELGNFARNALEFMLEHPEVFFRIRALMRAMLRYLEPYPEEALLSG